MFRQRLSEVLIACTFVTMGIIQYAFTQVPSISVSPSEGFILDLDSNNPETTIMFTIHNTGQTTVSMSLQVESADSTYLLYIDQPDASTFNGNIWIMRPDGSEKTQLTSDTLDHEAVWSPNGNKIAFWSDRSGNTDIWIMDSNGSNLKNLTDDPEVDAYPHFSSDGQYIIFNSYRDDPNGEVYRIDTSGDNLERLTTNDYPEFRPRYSPDGKYFITQSRVEGINDIYIYTNDGQEYVKLATPAVYDFQPSWKPDSKRVVWTSGGINPGELDILSANIDSSDFYVEFATPENDYFPRFSPDGQFLAFSKSTFYSTQGDEIFIWHKSMNRLIQITDSTSVTREWGPEWSPFLNQPSWLTVSSDAIQIASGDSTFVSVNIDASKLPSGNLTASVMIYDTMNNNLLAVVPINIDLFVENTPPVAKFSMNKNDIILGDSVFVDASESIDGDSDRLEYEWTFIYPAFWPDNIFTTFLENGKMAYLKPNTTGEYQVKLTVSDGLVESDTSKSFHVRPSLENIALDYSFIDTSWYRTNNVHFYDDKLFVAIEPMDVVRIYDLSGDSISFIKDINIPNVIRVYGIYNNLLYVGVPGPIGGFWGPGALNIYQIGTEWQVTPLLENYVPGTRDIFEMTFTETHTIVTDDATIYNIDLETDPSAPQILAQRTYGDGVSHPDIAGEYLYVGITYPERKIEILGKDSLTYVSELVMSPDWKNINTDGELLFIGFYDSLQIYSIPNPLEPNSLSTIQNPQIFNHPDENYQIRLFGKILNGNLLAIETDVGIGFFNISNTSDPEFKGYWASGRNLTSTFHSDNYYLMGYDIVGSLIKDKYFGLNKIILNFITSLPEAESKQKPQNFVLFQNYPNPFNPSTTIQYQLPKSSNVEITVFNLLGQQIWKKRINQQSAGQHEINVDLSIYSSGIYFYRLEAGNYTSVKKMILMK